MDGWYVSMCTVFNDIVSTLRCLPNPIFEVLVVVGRVLFVNKGLIVYCCAYLVWCSILLALIFAGSDSIFRDCFLHRNTYTAEWRRVRERAFLFIKWNPNWLVVQNKHSKTKRRMCASNENDRISSVDVVIVTIRCSNGQSIVLAFDTVNLT